MAKLRHIAISAKDLETTAQFYEKAFGMERVRQSKVAIMLSDGVVSLAILHLRSNDNAPDERGPDYIGLHHMGFLVDDVPAASAQVEEAGGTYHGQILNVGKGPESERKYRDPNGVVLDVTSPEHATSSWRVPV
ncbi:MAG: VOC family protein [Alphaproteobacteria bacterium]|jgi:catechol 2,3-dioxygenase-like lactoylglutathione lyase family enzyme